MPLRTGKGSAGGMYRYYTCSTKARQGKTGCEGRSIPMDKLDHLVASHLEERLLQPERLATILSSLLDRRQERSERRRGHLAELHRRITETDQRLNRLYDAIESGLADLNDSALKERMVGLKAIRDQTQADAERTQATLDNAGNQAITVDTLSSAARMDCGWKATAICGITCAPLPSVSRLQIRRFASWGQNRNCSKPSLPPLA